MNESFHEFVEALRKNIDKCPWAKELDEEKLGKEIKSETAEVIQAIDKKDYENLKEEIGDLMMNLTQLALLCEKKGYFKAKDVLVGAREKLIRRKPWVFGDMEIKTSEEAIRTWNEIKKKEKGRK